MKRLPLTDPLLLALALGAWTCHPAPPVPPPQPDAPVVVVPPDSPTCASPCDCACVNMAAHECPEARPTASGKTCRDVCEPLYAAKFPGLNVSCVAANPSLAEIRNCGVACAGGN